MSENIYGASQWEAIATLRYPDIQLFIDDYKKDYGYEPTYQAAEAYGAMQVLEAAVKKVGSLDRERLRDVMADLKVDTVFGPYQVDGKGVQTAKTALLVQWQQGQRKVVWPEDVAPSQPVYPMPAWK